MAARKSRTLTRLSDTPCAKCGGYYFYASSGECLGCKRNIHIHGCEPCTICNGTTRFRKSNKCCGCVINKGLEKEHIPAKEEIALIMRHRNGERVDYA